MTYDDVIELGWNPRHKNDKTTFWMIDEVQNKWLMSVVFNMDCDGFDQVGINVVDENCDHNEWENSECHFYGFIKTKEDLNTVMRFLEIKQY